MKNHLYGHIPQMVIASKSFGRSKTYENLLNYLVECALSGNIPKETTIATEIFGKSSFDPSQSSLVRVYVYNLRKKLKQYYQNEGAEDAIMLQIPKGSYKVEFVEKDHSKPIPKKISLLRRGLPIIMLLLISVLTNIYLWTNNKKKDIVNENGLWADLLSSEFPTMVVLGDLFIYTEYDSTIGIERNI